jgi:hypothetical protein
MVSQKTDGETDKFQRYLAMLRNDPARMPQHTTAPELTERLRSRAASRSRCARCSAIWSGLSGQFGLCCDETMPG